MQTGDPKKEPSRRRALELRSSQPLEAQSSADEVAAWIYELLAL